MSRDDEHAQLRAARQAAREAQRTAADLVTFADRMSPVLDPAQRVEYATLLARDEEARARREEAFDTLGLSVPSLEE